MTMTIAEEERIEQLRTELRTWRQILKQTDEHMAAMRDGWESEDVTDLRDSCRVHIGQLESELAEIDGREYTAPVKTSDGDHVRVGDVEDALAELSEMASDSDVILSDVMDAIADLSEDVSDLYGENGGE